MEVLVMILQRIKIITKNLCLCFNYFFTGLIYFDMTIKDVTETVENYFEILKSFMSFEL